MDRSLRRTRTAVRKSVSGKDWKSEKKIQQCKLYGLLPDFQTPDLLTCIHQHKSATQLKHY